MCGAETVEVSTFRGGVSDDEEEHARDEHGRILRDNVFGIAGGGCAAARLHRQRAVLRSGDRRRSWTTPTAFADIGKRVIRMIGDPEQRYREDPVRMLRAVRLAAKLRGEIEPKTRAPIKRMAALVQNVPPRACSRRC